METLKISHSYLEDLRFETKALVQGASALSKLFDRQEAYLNREDEASTLKAVHRTVVEQLERVRWGETFASYGDTKANLIFSLAGLGARIVVAATTENQTVRNIVGSAFDSEGRKKPFGTVMVCVGPEGLPGNVRVTCISQLARESHRSEAEIMKKLRDDGHLLLNEEAFSLLIERLIGGVRGGRLHLPVSRDKLVEITGLSKPKSSIKIIEVD